MSNHNHNRDYRLTPSEFSKVYDLFPNAEISTDIDGHVTIYTNMVEIKEFNEEENRMKISEYVDLDGVTA